MTSQKLLAEDIRRIRYLLDLTSERGNPDDLVTSRMLRIAFEALSTACLTSNIFPDDWLEVLYPPAKPVAEEVSDGS